MKSNCGDTVEKVVSGLIRINKIIYKNSTIRNFRIVQIRENSGQLVVDHFVDVNKTINMPKGANKKSSLPVGRGFFFGLALSLA